MTTKRVVILGATGMLGSSLLAELAKNAKFGLIATCRNRKSLTVLKKKYPNVIFRKFEAQKASTKEIKKIAGSANWVINAIGITKPHIHEDNPEEVSRAVEINAFFPYLLANATKGTKAKIIQIATDCVFSGKLGRYVETSPHDALDVYGKTKSLGEVSRDNFYNLRCSIIGRETKNHHFFMDWFLHQPKGAAVNGFTNHKWNGITTLHFAKICAGIVKSGQKLPHVQHVVPANVVSKATLLKIMANQFGRSDIIIKNVKAPDNIDRTLVTNDQKLNQKIWQLAGYKFPPTIKQMIEEYAKR